MNAITRQADEVAIDAVADGGPRWAEPGDLDLRLLLRLVGAVALAVTVLAAASSLLL